MKNFTRRGYLIVNANRETKLVYTFFLIFIALGFITIGVYQAHIIGWGMPQIIAHYLGDESQMMFPKEFLQLLEISHAHAFMMGIIYLTLAHILIACRIRPFWKQLLIYMGFLATAIDLAGPWLIRYVSKDFAVLLLSGWLWMWLIYAAYLIIPLFDMWIIPPPPED